MALATTCPRCQTGFRVVPDQLKIRRGLVRCGACRHVFSGLDSLRYVNEQTDGAAASPSQASVAPEAPAATGTGHGQSNTPPGAVLSAERLAAAYGRGEPDIDEALDDHAAPDAPAPAPAPPPGIEAGQRAPVAETTQPGERAPDVGHGDDDAGNPVVPPEHAPRHLAPANRLDRPTDLVVLEGLEELDDLDTLSLPDYLSEPEIPAELPPGPAPATGAIDDQAPAHPDAEGPAIPDAEGPAIPDAEGPTIPDAEGPAIPDAARPSVPASRFPEAVRSPDGAAEVGSSEDLTEPAGVHARTAATDQTRVEDLTPPVAPAGRPGEVPEAWSAALLAPDPGTRRTRNGDASGPEAVDFFATAARAGGFASRGALFSAVLCMVLGVTLALQLTLAGRDWLASRIPALEPALAALSGLIGLQVQAPRELDSLTLESFDVQAGASGDALVMDLLMRNRAAHPVRWPAIEMSLSDAAGVLLVRKVVLPADYLSPNTPAAGAPPSQETALRLALQATGFAPAGFSLKLFYP